MPRHIPTLLLTAALLASCAPAAPVPTVAPTLTSTPAATPAATLTPTPEPGLEDAPPGSYTDDETDDVYAQDGKLIYTKVGSEWVKVIEQPVYPDLRNKDLIANFEQVAAEMGDVGALEGRLGAMGLNLVDMGMEDGWAQIPDVDYLQVNLKTGEVKFNYNENDDVDVFHAGNVRVIDGQLYCAGYRWDGATESWKAEQNGFPLENPEAHVGWFYLGDIANGSYRRFMDRMLEEMGPGALDALFAGARAPGKYMVSDEEISFEGKISDILKGIEFGDQKYENFDSLEGRG